VTRAVAAHRPLVCLLVATGCLYLWDLDRSGWANSYYAAAVQAGTGSWKAFLFGGLDTGGYITTDKPPLGLWPMVLSARAFGLSSWTLLIPQALEGVATVGLLYATVRRSTGSAGAGLVAGAVLAVSPVAVLMFRYDNPDALLTLFLVLAAYATTRALGPPTDARWLALAGAAVGLGFLTKMLEAFVVLPALAAVYLLYADRTLLRRVRDVAVAGVACAVAAGWWLAVVQLWPAAARPWIGGSTTDSALELALGYNGLGRLVGGSGSSPGISGGWGATNLARIGRTDVGAEIAWLLPAAIVLGVIAVVLTRGRPVWSRERAALTMWLTWLGVTGLVFASMTGIFHSYYTVIQAPAVAALVAMGGHVLWQHRARRWVRVTLAGCAAASAVVAVAVLAVLPSSMRPWMLVVVGASAAAVVVLAARPGRWSARTVIGVALAAALVGPVAVDIGTVTSAHVSSGPMAGPAADPGQGGYLDTAVPATVPPELVHLLGAGRRYRWAAATVGARSASALELASGRSVMGIGGYNGTDPTPSLADFQRLVSHGEVHYFVAISSVTDSAIPAWVMHTFSPTAIDGVPVYDLAGPPSGP
jgi:4-amino-4-deoxy-L-arabinose transferase-like glycosyltransferase